MVKRTTFDLDTLKARGIDPRLAEYFRDAARFGEGTRDVALVVNGVKLGLVDATFDQDGQLCFDRILLEKAQLRGPAGDGSTAGGVDAAPDCYDFMATYPETRITLKPAQGEVALLVPTQAFQPGGYDLSKTATGGVAGLFNYDIMAQSSRFGERSSHSLYASTEVGLNAGDWIMRSRQLYASDDARSHSEHLYAYAQRTFTSQNAIFQAGQINIASPLFAGAPITGIQVVPEDALADGGGPAVEGVAQSEARIDVRQAGALIHSVQVPAGLFVLTEIPLLNGRADLEVTVVEGDGTERKFVVPMAPLNAIPSRAGYSFAAGKVRDLTGEESTQPIMATAAGSWSFRKNAMASGGAMVGSGYQALALGVDTQMSPNTTLSARSTFSSESQGNARGAQTMLSVSSSRTGSISVGASAMIQTQGYRDLLDTTFENAAGEWNPAGYKHQFTGTWGWSNPTWGGLNLSYSSVQTFDEVTVGRLVGSWGKSFRHATVSVGAETMVGASGQSAVRVGDAFFLSLSVPLGPRSLRTYVNKRGNRARAGAALSEKINDYANYRVAAETGDGGTDLTGNVSLMPRYTQLNLGYGRYGSGNTSYYGGLRGGAVVHGNSVTPSPYPIQDTFGVLSVGDLAGVKVVTPYGPVWTDPWGKAVIPQLPAFSTSRVEVVTKTLSRNVDIKNGFKVIEAARGSVSSVEFDIVKTRRVLVTAKDDQGRFLEKGSAVFAPDKTFVTTVVDSGQLFLVNAGTNEALKVFMPDGNQCELNLTLPEKPDENTYYERASASCRIL